MPGDHPTPRKINSYKGRFLGSPQGDEPLAWWGEGVPRRGGPPSGTAGGLAPQNQGGQIPTITTPAARRGTGLQESRSLERPWVPADHEGISSRPTFPPGNAGRQG